MLTHNCLLAGQTRGKESKYKRIKDEIITAKSNFHENSLYLLLSSIALISFSVLMFEITLTRIFSVMFSYHYVFIVVSVALFGMGIGGVFIHIFSHLFKKPFSGKKSFDDICLFVFAFSLSIPISIILVIGIPTQSIFIFYAIVFIPFFFSGAALALIFKRFPEQSNKLYSADLLGAGLACPAVMFSLNAIGGVDTALLLGVVSAIGGLILALNSEKKTTPIVGCIVLFISTLTFSSNLMKSFITDIPIRKEHKELYVALRNPDYDAEIVETRWSPYGRADLVNIKNKAFQKLIYIDGDSPTPMYEFNGDFRTVSHLQKFAGYFPFYFDGKDKLLIIGAGAGRDVLVGLMGGSKEITAVEINQSIADIVGDYSDYTGGIYSDYQNVNLIIDEGRSFIKRSKEKYDIILISLAITQTSGSTGAYALVENYLYTVEAFHDYLKHLKEEGRLVIVTHNDAETLKLFGIGIKALNDEDISIVEAKNHIAVVSDGMYQALILKKRAFTKKESALIHNKARKTGFAPIYIPFREVQSVLNNLFRQLGNDDIGLDLWTGNIQPKVNLKQPTDNHPFFFKWEKGLPDSLSSLLLYMGIITVTVLFAPMLYRSRDLKKERYIEQNNRVGHGKKGKPGTEAKDIFPFVLYFSMLGVGFMLIEIPLIQKFILFLGKPTLAVTVLLFSLLISGGIGSFVSNLINKNGSLRFIKKISLSVCVIVLIHALILPYVFEAFLGSNLVMRSIISAMLLFPLGFMMGIPFPMGIKILEEISRDDIPWMWGINGATSVIGSILATVIALSYGFNWALFFGAFAYFILFCTCFFLPSNNTL